MIRQFRYYLIKEDLPAVAIRFRHAVRKTVKAISRQPTIAPPYTLRMIRILHGKRDVKSILERERPSKD